MSEWVKKSRDLSTQKIMQPINKTQLLHTRKSGYLSTKKNHTTFKKMQPQKNHNLTTTKNHATSKKSLNLPTKSHSTLWVSEKNNATSPPKTSRNLSSQELTQPLQSKKSRNLTTHKNKPNLKKNHATSPQKKHATSTKKSGNLSTQKSRNLFTQKHRATSPHKHHSTSQQKKSSNLSSKKHSQPL